MEHAAAGHGVPLDEPHLAALGHHPVDEAHDRLAREDPWRERDRDRVVVGVDRVQVGPRREVRCVPARHGHPGRVDLQEAPVGGDRGHHVLRRGPEPLALVGDLGDLPLEGVGPPAQHGLGPAPLDRVVEATRHEAQKGQLGLGPCPGSGRVDEQDGDEPLVLDEGHVDHRARADALEGVPRRPGVRARVRHNDQAPVRHLVQERPEGRQVVHADRARVAGAGPVAPDRDDGPRRVQGAVADPDHVEHLAEDLGHGLHDHVGVAHHPDPVAQVEERPQAHLFGPPLRHVGGDQPEPVGSVPPRPDLVPPPLGAGPDLGARRAASERRDERRTEAVPWHQVTDGARRAASDRLPAAGVEGGVAPHHPEVDHVARRRPDHLAPGERLAGHVGEPDPSVAERDCQVEGRGRRPFGVVLHVGIASRPIRNVGRRGP